MVTISDRTDRQTNIARGQPKNITPLPTLIEGEAWKQAVSERMAYKYCPE